MLRTLRYLLRMLLRVSSVCWIATCIFLWVFLVWWELRICSMHASIVDMQWYICSDLLHGHWLPYCCVGSSREIWISHYGHIEYFGYFREHLPLLKCSRIISYLWILYLTVYRFPVRYWVICVGNFVLAVYGIYRPEDNDTLTLIDNDDIPGVVKLFF